MASLVKFPEIGVFVAKDEEKLKIQKKVNTDLLDYENPFYTGKPFIIITEDLENK